jgi:hypothetical protein
VEKVEDGAQFLAASRGRPAALLGADQVATGRSQSCFLNYRRRDGGNRALVVQWSRLGRGRVGSQPQLS